MTRAQAKKLARLMTDTFDSELAIQLLSQVAADETAPYELRFHALWLLCELAI